MNDLGVSKRRNLNLFQSVDYIESDCANNFKENVGLVNYDEVQKGNMPMSVTDGISVAELDCRLRSGSAICLIDTRDVRTFQRGHIIGAEMFNCTTRIMEMKAKKDWDKLKERKSGLDKIVLYNQRGEKTAHIMDFMKHVEKDFASVHFVTGGYEEFVRCFPAGRTQSSISRQKIEMLSSGPTEESNRSMDLHNATLSEILPFLFLGNEIDSNDAEVLQQRGITHILNVTIEVPFYHENLFIYKRVAATDCSKQDLRAYFEESIRFINEAYSKNGKVLVHCWAGVSRSTTIVAAYLMKHSKLNVLQTVKFIRSKRSIIEPNFNFLGQLERFHSDLERGVELRSKEFQFGQHEQTARKLECDLDDMRDLTLLAINSSGTRDTNCPPQKSHLKFIK